MPKRTFAYYLNTIKLKSTSKLHDSGLLPLKEDPKLVELLDKISFPIQPIFDPLYSSFTYWNSHVEYGSTLEFKDGVAVCETNEKPSYLHAGIYALILYNDYVKQSDTSLIKSFYKQIDFLLDQSSSTKDGIYWKHEEDIPRFSLTGAWPSGITQGINSSALLRAYALSKENKYLDAANEAISFALHDKRLYNALDDNMYWIEEYPSDLSRGVLNGFLFYLIALAELHTFIPKQNELDCGIKTLQHYLPKLQFKKHVKYALGLPEFGNILYQVIHYYQLLHLSKILNNGFADLARYWKGQLDWELIDRCL